MIDFYDLAQTCAPEVHPQTLNAIVKTESAHNPWAIGDNTKRIGRHPKTKDEAVRLASELIQRGHNIDLGLGQINSKNLSKLGLNIDQVLDPCTNLKAAATILGWGYNRAKNLYGNDQQAALIAALSAYNTGNFTRGLRNGYVQKVVSNAQGKTKSTYVVPAINNNQPVAVQRERSNKTEVESIEFTRNNLESPKKEQLSWDVFSEF